MDNYWDKNTAPFWPADFVYLEKYNNRVAICVMVLLASSYRPDSPSHRAKKMFLDILKLDGRNLYLSLSPNSK